MPPPDLLTLGEYKRLTAHLRAAGCELSDLLDVRGNELIEDCASVIVVDRLRRLLSRGLLLSQAVERWHARAIWMVSNADPGYPLRLAERLKEDSPPILYGCGDARALNAGGLAIVGSRDAAAPLIEYTESVAQLVASAQQVVVSGGARGVDQAAMRGALGAGGRAAGVLADSLDRAVVNREYRSWLLSGELVLISPYDPSAGFNVGRAMQRNKVIYGLADAGLVVSARSDGGGTWAGAKEQLKKLFLVPVYVRSTGEPSAGLRALEDMGARPWPNPQDGEKLRATLSEPMPSDQRSRPLEPPAFAPQQASEALAEWELGRAPSRLDEALELDRAGELHSGPASRSFEMLRERVLAYLAVPRKAAEVAAALGLGRRQAETWLRRLVDEGAVEKSRRPVRYVRRSSGLFEVQQ